MQLIENKALALALAFTLLVMAIPVGLVHNASGKQPYGSITAANKGVLGWVAQADTTTVHAYLPVITAEVEPTAMPPDASAGWLDYVNYYRGLAWLPPVTEDMTLSIAAQQLAACIVASNKFQEYEWQFSAYCQPFASPPANRSTERPLHHSLSRHLRRPGHRHLDAGTVSCAGYS